MAYLQLGVECEILHGGAGGRTIRPANSSDVLPKAAFMTVSGSGRTWPWLDEVVGYMDGMGWDVTQST